MNAPRRTFPFHLPRAATAAAALLLALPMAGCFSTPEPRPVPPPEMRGSMDRGAMGSTAEGMHGDAMSDDGMSRDGMGAMGGSDTVLMRVPDDPTISFNLWFDVGSEDDPKGKEGLAYLTASLLSNGSTRNRTYQEVLSALYPIASGYGARVDKEMTTFTGRTHRDNLDAFLELYLDALLTPRFSQEDFDRLRTNQINALEKNLRYAQDEELGKAALQSFVFEGTPYAHPALGTATGLEAITLADVKSFYDTYFTEDNVVIGLGGGYPQPLVGELRKALSRLGSSGRQEMVGMGEMDGDGMTFEPIDRTEVLLVSKPGADASISFGFPIDVHRGEADYYALWLANSWLGEHRNFSSHLYQVIRETRGMNYGDYSYVEWFPEGGNRNVPPPNVARNHQLFEVWIRTLPNQQAHFALRAAVRELAMLVDEGMTEEEFELTRSFLSKYYLQYAPTTRDRLGYAIDDRFYGIDDPGHLEGFADALASLTVEDVNAALKRHLRSDRLKIAIVTGEADMLKNALTTDAESRMEYSSEKPAEVLAEDKIIGTYPLGIATDAVTIVPVDEIFQ